MNQMLDEQMLNEEQMLHEQELKRLGRERDIELILNERKVLDTKEQIYHIINNLDNNKLEQKLVDELIYIHKAIDIYNVKLFRKKVNNIIYEQYKKKSYEDNTGVLYVGLFLTAIASAVSIVLLYCGPTPRG